MPYIILLKTYMTRFIVFPFSLQNPSEQTCQVVEHTNVATEYILLQSSVSTQRIDLCFYRPLEIAEGM